MGKSLTGRELGEGICQRKDGRYYARYTDRFQRRHEFYGKTVNAVRDKLRNARYEDEHGLYGTCESVTLDDWFAIFVRDYKVNARPSTRKGYYCNYSRISDILGKMPIVQIKQLHIQRIMADMQEQGYRSSTIKTCKAFLHNLFETAVFADVIPKNPVDGIVIKGEHDRKLRVLTVEEQTVFLNHIANSWYQELFNILLLTGLRIGEAMALVWEDVDFENKKLHITKNLTEVATGANGHGKYEYRLGLPKTESGIREVPLVEDAIHFFKSQYEKRIKPAKPSPFGNLVFTGRNGETVSYANIRNILRCACNTIRKQGYDITSITPHVFRHTFATRCYESGMDWLSISHILGHADVETTMRVYVHCLPHKVDEEIKKFKAVGIQIAGMTNENLAQVEQVICKDLNHEFCVTVEKCADLSAPYMKIYNRADHTKATQLSYLRIDKAEYTQGSLGDKSKWNLSEIEQTRFIHLLNDRSQLKPWGTNWETLILEFNRLNGLQPENTMHNLSRNPIFYDYLCYDTPVPDYTQLPAGKGKTSV